MHRRAFLGALGLGVAARALPGTDATDPAFARIPFDRWFAEASAHPRFRWSVSISHPQLSLHQRLQSELVVRLDGAELAPRRGKGQVVVFSEAEDAAGKRYQSHGTFDLENVQDGIEKQDIKYAHSLFFLPGDYQFRFAVLFTETGEHFTRKERFHVPALRNDPLPDAWTDLPAVEFIYLSEPLENYYLPSVEGQLHLPAKTLPDTPVHLIVNLTRSELHTRTRQASDRRMLFACLKVLSEVQFVNGSRRVELLDLVRHKVIFRQNGPGLLEWKGVRDALHESPSQVVDVSALEGRHSSLEFFVREISRSIQSAKAGGPPPILIVLSTPVYFEEHQEPGTLGPGELPASRVFYFRCHRPRRREPFDIEPKTLGGGGPVPELAHPVEFPEFDQLAPALKPLGPRVLDVASPEQFRKALATTLKDISNI